MAFLLQPPPQGSEWAFEVKWDGYRISVQIEDGVVRIFTRGDEKGAIRLSEEIVANGAALLRTACEHGLEGIIAKHRDRPYRSGRSTTG